jgi:phosphopantetheinyl transferase
VHVWLTTEPESLRRYDGGLPDLHLCAAESAGLAIAAVTRGRAGIAVERVPPPAGVDESLFDPAERADLDAEPAEMRLMSAVSIHVAKKAVLQAAGNDPACDPSGFGFAQRDAAEPWRPKADPGMERLEAWRVTHFPVPGGLAAVAVARDKWRLRFEIPREGR